MKYKVFESPNPDSSFQVQKEHPEFATRFQSTLQALRVHFTALEVLLHQEAILSVLQVAQSFQAALDKPPPGGGEADPGRNLVRRISMASTASLNTALKKIEQRRGGMGLCLLHCVTRWLVQSFNSCRFLVFSLQVAIQLFFKINPDYQSGLYAFGCFVLYDLHGEFSQPLYVAYVDIKSAFKSSNSSLLSCRDA